MIVALESRTSGQKVRWENFSERQIVLLARKAAHTPRTLAELWYSGIDVYTTSVLLRPSHRDANFAPMLALPQDMRAGLGRPVVPDV